MIFKPAQIVSLISRDMTLYPGDVISCGTSVGVSSMKPGSKVEIVIDGIGTLSTNTNDLEDSSMKICIIGAGAISGLLGAKLALAGEVTLIARGAHLEAMRQNGLKLIEEDGSEHVAKNVKATSKTERGQAGRWSILALKAHQVSHRQRDSQPVP
jgi:NADPH-dependent 2,4-dienoyl-CoA reductase/sulfur reductase-like enzyme